MGAILDVIRPCIAWIPILWGEKYFDLFIKIKIDCDDYEPELQLVDDNIVHGPIPELPFDIMINILSRLPAKCIYQVWQIKPNPLLYALTTPPLFMRTHLNRATPTIVVQSFTQSTNNDIKLFLFDEETYSVEATGVKFDLCDAYCKKPVVLCGSYDGFLFFKTQNSQKPVFCIWNPVTKEQVIMSSPDYLIYVCGFYFHPSKKEYEVVYVCMFGSQCHFQVINLRSTHTRSVGSCSYPPDYQRPPVFINGILYWMVDDFMYLIENHVDLSFSHSILTFNIETEEFSTMETVMPSGDTSRYYRKQFHLFEMDGELSLFDNSSFTEVFIWVFNCITKCWVKMHSMVVPIDGRSWDFYWHFKEILYIKKKGEFLIKHRNGRMVSCNLSLGSWKFVEKKGFEGDDFTATIHTPSLISLHAADTVISLKR